MEVIVEGSTTYNGDCLVVMDNMKKCSVDSIVTDPPYHLTSIVERFGKASIDDDTLTSKKVRSGADSYSRLIRTGFMGKEWDGGDIAFQVDTWRKCLELLKPGGHLIAFSGSRTYHRMAVAIEDAGFEIRDQCIWLYGSGFPKSHKVGEGWGTALKPAHEPMVLARKPINQKSVADNVLKHGVGGINIDDCRVQSAPGEQDQTIVRFPSNVMHDGSCVVEDIFPDVSSKYFYSAKTNQAERNAGANNSHPTVKPVELMRYLVRLVTPKNGLVLDPFMGSGSTGMAAREEEFKFIGIEKEEEYYEIAKARIKNVKPQLKLFDI